METDSQEGPHASSTMQNWGVETLIVETDRNKNKNCTILWRYHVLYLHVFQSFMKHFSSFLHQI